MFDLGSCGTARVDPLLFSKSTAPSGGQTTRQPYLAANGQDQLDVAVAHDGKRDPDDGQQTDQHPVHVEHIDRSARSVDGAVAGVDDATGGAGDVEDDGEHPGGDDGAQTSPVSHHRHEGAARRRHGHAARDRDEHVRDERRERAYGDHVTVHDANRVAGPVGAGVDGVGVQGHDADGEHEAGDRHVEEQHVGRRHAAAAPVQHGDHERVGGDREQHGAHQQRRLGSQFRRADGRHHVTGSVVGHRRHCRVGSHRRVAVIPISDITINVCERELMFNIMLICAIGKIIHAPLHAKQQHIRCYHKHSAAFLYP